MPTWNRETATLVMTSPLGGDKLIAISLSANEAISQPFKFEIGCIAQQGEVKPDDLLNQKVCVTLQSNSQPLRYFHGIVQQMSDEGVIDSPQGELHAYRLVLVPRLGFLGQTVDCRVHQNKSVSKILDEMFKDAGMEGADYSIVPQGSPRDFVVQFNESDLQFATRLMEEEGYFYFFEHTASHHKLIVANNNSGFPDTGASMHLRGQGAAGAQISAWTRPTGTTRGKMKLKDYDPKNPDTSLEAERPTTLQAGGSAQRDQFRWPALSREAGTVKDRAEREMEAAEAGVSLYEGASRFGKLVAGGKFKIENKPAGSSDGQYVLRQVTHTVTDNTVLGHAGGATYANRFTAFPVKINWRQPLATPRPRMSGIYVAVVIGPEGEEIYTDDLGRVQVKFPWDHRGEQSADQKCWARVIQPWAGNGWGAQFIPRVDTEVAVAFVDGDPDRPIVVGGLYNGRDKPIYSKADKTKSGFRTRSSLKGGTSDFNEFTFEDKKGQELVFLHAQKDFKTTVENDQTLTVDNCRIVTVKKDETVEIQNNQTVKVKMDHKMTVTDGNHDVNVKMGNMTTKVDMGNHDLNVKMGNMTTKVDMGNVSLKAGLGKIDNEAMQAIEFKVGQSSVKIDQMGVTITGMMIKIEGQIQTQVKGLMTQVNADAMLMVKGAITMIN